MIKTLSNIFKQDKEKFVIPRSVQQVIPIETIWSDGIFKIGRNKFARTYKFTDINYAVASKVDKETMFLEYMDLLNSFDCGGTTKITINNRRLNGNYSPTHFGLSLPEVTEVRHNEDGTIVLTIHAVCDSVVCNDVVITHELTMKIQDDGTIQYVGNRILDNGIDNIPRYQYRLGNLQN